MSLIEFSTPGKYLIYPFLFPLSYIGRYFCLHFLPIFTSNTSLFVIVMMLSESSCGIIEIIKKRCWKSKHLYENMDRLIQREDELISSNKKKYIKIKEVFILFLIALIDISFNLFLNLLVANSFNSNYKSLTVVLRVSQIIFLGILSYFILNIPIYRFHIVCFVITALLLTLILMAERATDKTSDLTTSEYIIQIVICVVAYCINSIQYVLHKYIMDKHYYSPYSVLGITGLMEIGIWLIIIGFGELFHNEKLTFSNAAIGWSNLTEEIYYIFCLIGAYFLGIVLNIIIILTNLFLTPPYNGINDTLNGIVITLLQMIISKSIFSVLTCVILLCAFIICLIYSEIIVLHCCSIGKDTKKEIVNRGIEETKGMEDLIIAEIRSLSRININDENKLPNN